MSTTTATKSLQGSSVWIRNLLENAQVKLNIYYVDSQNCFKILSSSDKESMIKVALKIQNKSFVQKLAEYFKDSKHSWIKDLAEDKLAELGRREVFKICPKEST